MTDTITTPERRTFGTVKPTGGSARLAGFDVATEPLAARRASSVVFQESVLDWALSGRRNLELHARLWGVPTAVAGPRITTLVSPSPVLTSTNAGRSRRPPEIRASSVTSKPAPPSTSSQMAATRGFSVGGRITTARSPTMPNQSPGR